MLPGEEPLRAAVLRKTSGLGEWTARWPCVPVQADPSVEHTWEVFAKWDWGPWGCSWSHPTPVCPRAARMGFLWFVSGFLPGGQGGPPRCFPTAGPSRARLTETRRFSESPGTRARPTGSLPRGTGQWPQTCPHQCLTLPHVWPELMPRETIVPTSFSMTRTVPEGRQQQASVPLPAGAHIPSALCVPHVSSVQAETLDPRLWSVWTSG